MLKLGGSYREPYHHYDSHTTRVDAEARKSYRGPYHHYDLHNKERMVWYTAENGEVTGCLRRGDAQPLILEKGDSVDDFHIPSQGFNG